MNFRRAAFEHSSSIHISGGMRQPQEAKRTQHLARGHSTHGHPRQLPAAKGHSRSGKKVPLAITPPQQAVSPLEYASIAVSTKGTMIQAHGYYRKKDGRGYPPV
ncbi:hypothetical protein CXT96_12380 [Akkermansia muciniphila]|jgi:hypothetical protein|nr:hypothetical protein CXT92_09105 [Akkermansia muciniphila]PNC86512.1 hypothetical protein CXT97_08595 [Akkermansia muciniphila]PNC99119.1 hypothetical protein CXT90_06130 [Akkermansia muciniphila]PND11953.1 hypothetical protein CXT96_12380 [Akkermansia muciniphila]